MRERVLGAQEALAGLTVCEGVRDPDTAARVVGELLDGPDPPTAFFGTNNRITVGILGELHRRRSPAAVVGFDDFEMSHLMPRPFSVITYDARALGRQAAELLFRRIGGDRSAPTTTTLPTVLVDRGLRGF